MVTGYEDGQPFSLRVDDVEGHNLLALPLVGPARDMLAEARGLGLVVVVSSAFRTIEKQRYFYDGWTAGLPGFNPADKPGFSKHQLGTAMDLHFASGEERERFAADVAPKYGFARPVAREPWHFVGTPPPATEQA